MYSIKGDRDRAETERREEGWKEREEIKKLKPVYVPRSDAEVYTAT